VAGRCGTEVAWDRMTSSLEVWNHLQRDRKTVCRGQQQVARAISRVTRPSRVQCVVTSFQFRGAPSGTEVVSPAITVLPLLHTHLSPLHEVCDSPDQAAHYHTVGTKFGVSPLTGPALVSG
jgi:hypothetical protein